jgi:hypothetical protein
MAIEPQYRELFSETVTLYPPAAVDKYGKRTWSASGVSACAHLMAENQLSKTADGRDVLETGKVFLYGQFTVTTDYRIVLADGTEPIIIAVDTPYDQNGWHHTVIRIGR